MYVRHYHLQIGVEGFLEKNFIDAPLGKTKYYAIYVNFKFVACLINTVSYGFECTSIKTNIMCINVLFSPCMLTKWKWKPRFSWAGKFVSTP